VDGVPDGDVGEGSSGVADVNSLLDRVQVFNVENILDAVGPDGNGLLGPCRCGVTVQ